MESYIHLPHPETLWKTSDQEFKVEFNMSEIFSYKFLAMWICTYPTPMYVTRFRNLGNNVCFFPFVILHQFYLQINDVILDYKYQCL